MRTIRKEIKTKWLLLFGLLLILCFGSAVQSTAANVVTSAKQISGGKWVSKAGGKKYRKSNGKYIKNKWVKIDGKLYHFGAKGYYSTGFFECDGVKYYANRKGVVYYEHWLEKQGYRYYFMKNARMAVSRMVKYKDHYFYFDKEGHRVTSSWVDLSGRRYYFNKDGYRLSSCWLKKGDKYYYFDANGVMLRNSWVGDYYVGKDGYRLKNCKIGEYELGEDGKRIKKLSDKFIFVGDSRVVGMQSAVGGRGNEYIALVGAGYNWFSTTAYSELQRSLKKTPNARVILMMGVNDTGNIQSYISFYRKLISRYTSAQFYVVSVNPIVDSKASAYGYFARNYHVTGFNKPLKAAFKDIYIDTYTYLRNTGMETADGVHYSAATYQKIYNYIKKNAK